MIFIDAREGLSGDMVLAALIGLMEPPNKDGFVRRLGSAAGSEGLQVRLLEIDDAGDRGTAISYTHPEPGAYGTLHAECLSRMSGICDRLGGGAQIANSILDHVFAAEGEAHGLPKEEVHLHEIGRPQAMVNIAGIGGAATELVAAGAGEFVCSTISTGGGATVISHGVVRIPPPASAILLRGLRHTTGDAPGERATPTGIAAVKALISSQSDDRPKDFSRKSVGFGTKRFAGRLGRTIMTWSP